MKTLTLLAALLIACPAHAGQFTALITAAFAKPNPQPAPAPSGICDNCSGTGKLGDGTITVPCPVCGGDGRLDTADSHSASDAGSGATLNAIAVQPIPQTAPASGFTEQTLPADAQPTPMPVIGDALHWLNPRGKTFIDIGCGFDCRAGITAARYGATRVIAIEKDPELADSARRYVEHAGLSDRITVITADAADVEFPAGAVGYAYLWEDTLLKLAPKIRTLSRFASFAHRIPGMTTPLSGDLHVYQKQTATQVMQQFRAVTPTRPTTVYHGRVYTAPVCNRPGCSMCNAIRRGLGWR